MEGNLDCNINNWHCYNSKFCLDDISTQVKIEPDLDTVDAKYNASDTTDWVKAEYDVTEKNSNLTKGPGVEKGLCTSYEMEPGGTIYGKIDNSVKITSNTMLLTSIIQS